ncbi:molecular chaperone [uncultured Sphingomonas sp.]|uniref:fimbrial biogenesis chaperone n=1 Tax=uncultured Sphingomonas sp. TaxID=158754 RepID=UPI00261C2E2F|nr:molecular chaperone [uncultured Sphingomonas sp.]
MTLRLFRLFAFLLLGLAAPAHAATVVIWPIDPVIAAGARATALWIENKGNAPVTLQVRTLRWTQEGGEDRHVDQDRIVASPPIATVAPGQRQLVRILRRDVADTGSGEQSYRLLIDELPPAIDAKGADTAPRAQLAVQMRYSIPLFVHAGASATAQPVLAARITLAEGRRYLVVTNSGARHARLVDLRGGRTPVLQGLIGYVLPGRRMRWPLPDAAADLGKLTVNVNGTDTVLPITA